jgi:hypothetical protein
LYAVTREKITDVSEIKEAIQGLDEGQKQDILSTCITNSGGGVSSGAVCIDKNNYSTYVKQIQQINYMYNNRSDYGGEILRAVIDTLCSFIGGEGLSVKAEKEKTRKYVETFLKKNKLLDGSELIDNITTGEMEGKDLMMLTPGDDFVKVNNFTYWITPYEIEHANASLKEYTKAVVTLEKKKLEEESNKKTLSKDKFVYVKLGGSPDRVNRTPPTVANILTDIENFSRAKYDMRKNNHLFGRVTPVFLVETLNEAKALQNKINSMDNVIGRAYAGTAKQVLYLEPSGKGREVISKEMIDLLRIISMNTGIPIQYLAYPDLLSNRATAENMLEAVNAATVKKRLIWEEAFTELTQKSMIIATEKGIEGAVNDPDGFEIKLNFATLALLKQVAEIWVLLAEQGYISKASVRSRLPGINITNEEKLLKKEKEERIEDMPTVFKNNADENAANNGESQDENKDKNGG